MLSLSRSWFPRTGIRGGLVSFRLAWLQEKDDEMPWAALRQWFTGFDAAPGNRVATNSDGYIEGFRQPPTRLSQLPRPRATYQIRPGIPELVMFTAADGSMLATQSEPAPGNTVSCAAMKCARTLTLKPSADVAKSISSCFIELKGLCTELTW